MPTENASAYLELPLPHIDNNLSFDVGRIIESLEIIDTKAEEWDDALEELADPYEPTPVIDAIAELAPGVDAQAIIVLTGESTAAMANITSYALNDLLSIENTSGLRSVIGLNAVALSGEYSDLENTPSIPVVVADANDTTSARVLDVGYLAARGVNASLDLTAFNPTPVSLAGKGIITGYTTADDLGISSDTTRGAIIYFASSNLSEGIVRKFYNGVDTYTQYAIDDTTWSAWSLSELFTSPLFRVQALGSISGSNTVDLNLGFYVTLTQTGNMTLAFTMPADHISSSVAIITIDIARSGSHTINLPAGTRWDEGSAPTFSTSNTDTIILSRVGTNNWLAKRGRKGI